MSAIENRVDDFIFTSNGYSFKRTIWNGISVVQEVSSGYYSANNVCRENSKRFENISSKKYWNEYIATLNEELANEHLMCRLQTESAVIPVATIDFLSVDNDFRGTYVHPFALHFLCEHINYSYAIKVSRLMNLLNERNHLTNQTLEQTIENLNQEIIDLKAQHQQDINRLDSMQSELISRAETIDEQETVIEMQNETIREYNQPFNQEKGCASIYALAKDPSHFQLRIDPFGEGTNGIRNMRLINAKEIKTELIKVLKNESLITIDNRTYLISMNKLDYVFNLIIDIKNNTKIELPSIEVRNSFIDKKLSQFHSRRRTTQNDGFIYEYEVIKSRDSYIPWKLIPQAILNEYGEYRKDRGIDAVEINNNEITKIIQIKKHEGTYLRRDELQMFIAKCSNHRYSNASKLLIIHNSIISNKLRRELEELDITIEVL